MHTVAVYVYDEHDYQEDREPVSEPTIGQGLESTFTRARHGTREDGGHCDGKSVYKQDSVRWCT